MSQTNPLNEPAVKPAQNLPMDRPRKSGFVLKPIDVEAAIQTLHQMTDEADPRECQETLDYLMKALNETRREGGERILFPWVK